jgi:hypothetical protein
MQKKPERKTQKNNTVEQPKRAMQKSNVIEQHKKTTQKINARKNIFLVITNN